MPTALSALLSARRFAVVGASTHRLKVGHQIFANLLEVGKGHGVSTIPIHPQADSILGQKVVHSIAELTKPIDVVVIAIPAGGVLETVDQIITHNKKWPAKDKVKAVIVITAGFAEAGAEGRALQHAVATKLALANIRMLGPNTLGALCPEAGINASFGQRDVAPGTIGFISQSGAMLTAVFDAIQNRNVGVSFAVSLGNAVDLDENDCLEYAIHDPHTKVVIAYIESFHNLPRFFELAAQLNGEKPLLVLKGGISERGQRASASHTAALATNQVLLDAAAQQVGFTLVNNLEELLNSAFFLAHHRSPENIMVITNAGGPAVNTIDELARNGVPLANWSTRAKADFAELLPGMAIHNPLDLLGDADPTRLKVALQIAQRDLNISSALIILTPQAVTDIPGMVDTVLQHQGKKPLFVALIGGQHLEKYRERLREAGIQCVSYPNDVAAMLKPLTQLTQRTGLPQFVHSPIHISRFSQPYSTKPVPQPSMEQGMTLLKEAGFQLPKSLILSKLDLNQLSHIQYPVYAKTGNLSIVHKKDAGAIYGVVSDVADAVDAYKKMSRFGNDVIFQQLMDIEHELLLGYENDPQFGPYLTIGWGGSFTNSLADRQYAFLPTTRGTLAKTWRRTKAAAQLKLSADQEKNIIDAMEALQKVVMGRHFIQALEINPLAITKKGVVAVDLKLRY